MTASIPALLQPLKDRLAAATKDVSQASFGDVLRIVWTTYYFGADLKWHNARTGNVEDPEVLRQERDASEGDWEWMIPTAAPADQAKLIAAIEAVEVMHRQDTHYGPYYCICGDKWPCSTIAALTQALGGDTA